MNICIQSLHKDGVPVATSGNFETDEDLVQYLNALSIGTFTNTTMPYNVDIELVCCEPPDNPPLPPEWTFVWDSAMNPISLVKTVAMSPIVIPPCTDAGILTYSIIGTMPSGISFNTTTRTFTGTYNGVTCPTTASVLMRCSDGLGSADTAIFFSIACAPVNPPPVPPATPFTWDSSLNPINLVKSTAMSATVIPACSDAESLTYSIVGTLPTGISFNTGTRTFTGTYTGVCPATSTVIMRCSDGTSNTDTTIFFSATCAALPTGLYVSRNGTSLMNIVDKSAMTLSTSFSIASASMASLQEDASYIYGIGVGNTTIYKYAKVDGSLVSSYVHTGWTVVNLHIDGSLLYFVEDTASMNQIVVRKLTVSTMLIAAGSLTQAVANSTINAASMATNATYLFVAVDWIAMRITKASMTLAGSNITVTGVGTSSRGALAYNTSDGHIYVAGWATNLYRIDGSGWTVANTQAPGTSRGVITYVSGVWIFATEVTGGNTIIQKLSTTLVRTSLYTMPSIISTLVRMLNDGTSIFVNTSANQILKVNATTGVLWGTYNAVLVIGMTVS